MPAGTQTFAVTAYDPDAPTGSGWWHWALYNLPAAQTSLAQGAGSHAEGLPKGAIALKNDFGTTNFGGARPKAMVCIGMNLLYGHCPVR